MIEQKDCTIIIPHLSDVQACEVAIKECLKSLEETVPNMKKIVIYNNAFKEERKFLYDDELKDNTAVMIMTEQGQCKAVNAAIATTNTPWILVTNDDMIFPPGWFEKLTSNIEYDDLHCISPKLIEPRPGAPLFESYFCGGAGGDFDKQKFLLFDKEYNLRSEEEKKLRTGFNLPFLIKRELWDIVEGYDINYDPWGSNGDSDLEYKIRLAGIQPMQNPRCIVYHFSQTSGTFEPKNDSYRFRNYAYFKEKWGFDRTDTRIWEADFEMPKIFEGRIYEPWWEDFFIDKSEMFGRYEE